MATLTNPKTGETIDTPFTNEQAAKLFVEAHGDQSHWLWFWLHKIAQEMTQKAATPNRNNAIAFLADSFVLAIGMGLKRPMIRVHYKDQRFKFYLSQKGTICLKSGMLVTHETVPGNPPVYTHDPVGDEFYVGCLLRGELLPAQQGRWGDDHYGNRITRPLAATEREFMDNLSKDPTGFLAQCSKDMGRCCYCNQPLEDERSKQVGYGQTCAKRWGLPWGTQKSGERVPSFARDYDETAHTLLNGVRDNPKDENTWNVFGDWLEERGLPRCTMPAKAVTMPRNDSVGAKKTVTVSAPAPKPVETPVTPEPVPEISTAKLTWDAGERTLFADGSDVQLSDYPARIKVKSHKTGDVKTFHRGLRKLDPEGDLMYVDYAAGDITLRLFND